MVVSRKFKFLVVTLLLAFQATGHACSKNRFVEVFGILHNSVGISSLSQVEMFKKIWSCSDSSNKNFEEAFKEVTAKSLGEYFLSGNGSIVYIYEDPQIEVLATEPPTTKKDFLEALLVTPVGDELETLKFYLKNRDESDELFSGVEVLEVFKSVGLGDNFKALDLLAPFISNRISLEIIKSIVSEIFDPSDKVKALKLLVVKNISNIEPHDVDVLLDLLWPQTSDAFEILAPLVAKEKRFELYISINRSRMTSSEAEKSIRFLTRLIEGIQD